MRSKTLLMMLIVMCVVAAVAQADSYVPWDELTEASWIDFGDATLWPNMYPVNAARPGVAASYAVAFSPAGAGNKAKGMNAIKFRHGGQTTGHIVSLDQAGTFEIVNTGKDNPFTDVLVLVAMNAPGGSIADGFRLTLHPETGDAFGFDPNHFVFYDNPFGRPSGYYFTRDPADPHTTNPAGEPIAYAFDTAMVTLYAVEGITSLAQGQSVRIDYRFGDLPGPAVFSAYGYIGTDPVASIYHTNRAFLDANDSQRNPVSTFAVTVPGDVNKDLRVDLADLAVLAENWMVGAN
ncbi:MAG TPA: hypothetical protein VMW24_15420 [Sedimentisphaerales bacterium]|nr:hypothetical protein [Sedimentisphaerales bacterium]